MTQELETKIRNIQQDCLAKLKELRLRAEKEIILLKIEDRGEHFYIRDKVLREEDEEIALAFVKKQGESLKYLPEFQNNKKVVLAAVKQDGYALKYASKELQNDKEVVLVAVKQWGFALRLASAELQEDEEIVLISLEERYQNHRSDIFSYFGIGEKIGEKFLSSAIQHLKQK